MSVEWWTSTKLCHVAGGREHAGNIVFGHPGFALSWRGSERQAEQRRAFSCRACAKRKSRTYSRSINPVVYLEPEFGRTTTDPAVYPVLIEHARQCPSFWPMLLFEMNQCIEGLDVATLRAMDLPTLEALADRWLDWKNLT